MTTTPAENPVQRFMHASDRSVWATAALVLAVGGSGTDEQRRAAATVLQALGLDLEQDTRSMDRGGVAAQAAAPVHQVAALLRGEGQMWAEQSDEALLAQGHASAQGASMMARFGVPALQGLGAALATPGARMLDVGTGVAAMAVSYAEQFPALTVVGIDVMPRVLALAAQTVASSTVSDRVVLRQQDVGELDERDTYAFAWLPAPFVPETRAAQRHSQARGLARARWLADAGTRQVRRRPGRRRRQPLQDDRLRRYAPWTTTRPRSCFARPGSATSRRCLCHLALRQSRWDAREVRSDRGAPGSRPRSPRRARPDRHRCPRRRRRRPSRSPRS